MTRDEEPSEARNGIGTRSLRVRDRDPKIGRHVRGGAGGGSGDRSQVRLDELSGLVLNKPVGELVLDSIDQLNVTDGAGRLLDKARYAWIPLTAQSNRPIYCRVAADPRGPLW